MTQARPAAPPRRPLLLGGCVLFVENIFYVGILPLLPLFAERYDLSAVGAGVLVGAYAAGLIVGSWPAVLLGPRIGMRRLAATGLCLLSISTAVFALADSVIVLDASRVIQGVGASFAWVGVLAWITAIVPGARRGSAIGIVMSSAVTGSILGPAVGALAAVTSLGLVFGILALVQGTLGVAIMGASAEGERAAALTGSAPAAVPRSVRVIGLAFVAVPAALAGVYEALTPLSLDAAGAGTGLIAGVFVAGAVGEVVLGPIAGRASDSVGRLVPLRLALGTAPPLCVLLTIFTDLTALVVIGVSAWLAITTAFTPGLALMADLSEGAASAAGDWGVLNVVLAAGVLAGSIGGPALASRFGNAAPYLLLGCVCALVIVAANRAGVGRGPEREPHTAKTRCN